MLVAIKSFCTKCYCSSFNFKIISMLKYYTVKAYLLLTVVFVNTGDSTSSRFWCFIPAAHGIGGCADLTSAPADNRMPSAVGRVSHFFGCYPNWNWS
jgi:hypothetical protein